MSPARRASLGAGAIRAALALAPVVLTLLAQGCASGPAKPPASPVSPPASHTPAAKARPKSGYDGRVDDVRSVDGSVLAGRRIVLDPGHGGYFRGSLGVNGLTEAEVNLGVALNLRGLLEAQKAVVLMTRTDDRDYLTPADSTLRSDLAERMRLANEFAPDLFVSIHHNADARGAHDVNETQTYYKLGDEGPSLDAAQSVHRYLVRNLGIEQQRILPGNYYVLRNSASPALLTESSYLTNPDVESKLALGSKQRLEAEALYLGLVHYFARPRPAVEDLHLVAAGMAASDTVVRTAWPGLAARVRGAFDRVDLSLNGAPIEPRVTGDRIEWSAPEPLAGGLYEASLRVALSGAGTAREQRLRFRVRVAPASIRADFPDQPAWDGRRPLALRVRVLDANGLAIRDSLRVRVRGDRARLLSPGDTVVTTADGEGWAYLKRAGATEGAAAAGVRVDLVAASGTTSTTVPTATARVTIASRPALRTEFARVMPADTVLRGAPGTTGPSPARTWINRDGFVRLAMDSGRVRVPQLPGYRTWPSDDEWPPRFAAIAGGALLGRRIVLDADGGGDLDGGTGKNGTRAANLNLEVAHALAGFLEAAGAEVRLTRTGDLALSEVERVQASEAFHADRFLRIGHRAEPPMLGYYFSSVPGKRWAERTRATLSALGLPAPPPAEDAQYPLQQTSCPALYVSVARIDDPHLEARYLDPGARAEAYAVRRWRASGRRTRRGADSLEVRDRTAVRSPTRPCRWEGSCCSLWKGASAAAFRRSSRVRSTSP
jgi:N-acetylmuramoyl-L-alanine amidase